ncbi:hypothetical protein N7509_001321 [Penicillium cosmopolitanum]|uniref:Uncharacterized protein n=1 Tax=Penicillium cosmopolitanum TaxID=1131564 RepID=A0A9X0BF22_9EURO|nr:uncharacterized protein N7509_001321 [Penicillium cosmopolitanum]KAJ5414694.1 hypothetical protein N7509_001321 [Penicillium cosmopolitanum]
MTREDLNDIHSFGITRDKRHLREQSAAEQVLTGLGPEEVLSTSIWGPGRGFEICYESLLLVGQPRIKSTTVHRIQTQKISLESKKNIKQEAQRDLRDKKTKAERRQLSPFKIVLCDRPYVFHR